MRAEAPGLVVFVLLALSPWLLGVYWTTQLAVYVIYGLLAMSLALIWGRAGLLCFGQAMFFGIGGYAMAIVTTGMLGDGLASTHLGLAVAVLGAAGFAMLLGAFLFLGRGLSGPYLAIVTLAIALILERVVNNWYALGGYNGILDVPPLAFGSVLVTYDYWDPAPQLHLVLAIAASVYFLLERLLRSPFGVLLSALKTNPRRLEFLGFSVLSLRVGVFVVGAATAGLAGALFAAVEGFVSPSLIGFLLSTEVLIWVALGGREMLLAAFLGAIVVRVIEATLAERLAGDWLLALGLVLMASVVLLPKGLIATPLGWLARRR
jgi:urea transport system permease protein